MRDEVNMQNISWPSATKGRKTAVRMINRAEKKQIMFMEKVKGDYLYCCILNKSQGERNFVVKLFCLLLQWVQRGTRVEQTPKAAIPLDCNDIMVYERHYYPATTQSF